MWPATSAGPHLTDAPLSSTHRRVEGGRDQPVQRPREHDDGHEDCHAQHGEADAPHYVSVQLSHAGAHELGHDEGLQLAQLLDHVVLRKGEAVEGRRGTCWPRAILPFTARHMHCRNSRCMQQLV